jgi:hypothetical protein
MPNVPLPKWKVLRTEISLAQAIARIQIREFVVRFASLMEGVARSHMEELAKIAGKSRGTTDDDGDEVEVQWVSEACVKAVVLGLLELIAGNGSEAKVCIRSILLALVLILRLVLHVSNPDNQGSYQKYSRSWCKLE